MSIHPYPGYGPLHKGTWNMEQLNFGNPILGVVVLRAQIDETVVENYYIPIYTYIYILTTCLRHVVLLLWSSIAFSLLLPQAYLLLQLCFIFARSDATHF